MPLSLDRLRRDAKTLRKAYNAGDPAAKHRLALHPPRPEGTPLRHSDFLHVIALEQNFPSWPKLKIAAETQGLDRAAREQRLKIALYHGQTHVIDRLLTDTPSLAQNNFPLQIALLNLEAVKTMLAEDPTRATRLYGPRRPMLHLAFSKYIHARPDLHQDMLGIAQALVNHGASVNDTCPVAPDNDYQLSALYGAIGHANNMGLARWLLENGADPNDGESLYHATELGHHEGLKMLLDHGADPAGTNALLRAMDFNDHEAVEMLMKAGANADDFDGTHVGGERPWVIPALHQAARRTSDTRMITLLLDNGADPARIHDGCTAYGYARVYGNRELARAIEAHGTPPALTQQEQILAKAADGEPTDGLRVDPETLPEAYRNIIRIILHLPSKLGHIRRLAAIGIETDRPDAEGLTPVHIAGWEGLPEIVAWALEQKPDLTHINHYGGDLLSTIIHGSENCPSRADRDYITCARLALEQGIPLPARAIGLAGDEDLAECLAAWAEDHPDQVI